MSSFGIAVVTYRRLDALRRTLDALIEKTTAAHQLVVVEDGGDDGTVTWCRSNGVRVVTGRNRGVGWNKNRGLFALEALGCDPILLLEDDCFPIQAGWEADWARATRLWGHVLFAPKRIVKGVIAGAGTPMDPYVSIRTTAQCASSSIGALERVGYFDTRFTGYGIEHKEWTARMNRAGFGVRTVEAPEGLRAKGEIVPAHTPIAGKVHIVGGLYAPPTPSHHSPDSVERNRKTARELKREPIYRRPWQNESEKAELLAEISLAGLAGDSLAAAIEKRARPL